MNYSKFSLHAGNGVGRASIGQLLYMRVEVAGGNLCVSTQYRFQHGVVDEDVLVLGLHHVVTLGTQARHVTVDIDRLLVTDPLQHRVDDDKRPRAPDARTVQRKNTSSRPWLIFVLICAAWIREYKASAWTHLFIKSNMRFVCANFGDSIKICSILMQKNPTTMHFPFKLPRNVPG